MQNKIILHNEEDAIQQAIEAGYIWSGEGRMDVRLTSRMQRIENSLDIIWTSPSKNRVRLLLPLELLSDSTFWQALGKARGWMTTHLRRRCPNHGRNSYGGEKFCFICGAEVQDFEIQDGVDADAWKHHALRYFDTRLSNGDLSAFWQSLP